MTIEVSYYPGCSLEGTASEFNSSMETVANKLDVNLAELPGWTCCGSSSAHATSDRLAIVLPGRNLMIAQTIGKDVVVPCASCFQRLKAAEKALISGKESGIFGDFKGGFQIKHVADFFWNSIGEKAITNRIKRRLARLNPVCYYGCLITRPPRITDVQNAENPQELDKIIATLGADVREWSYKTDCCGGNVMLTRPDIAKKMVTKIFDGALEAGADCIVTACPLCQSNLDTRVEEINVETGKQYRLPVFYFTELMGLAFGEFPQKWLAKHVTDPLPLLQEKHLI
jgi:heterodisulfide reductase subunit B